MVQQVVVARYISEAKLLALLNRLFPGQSCGAAVSLTHGSSCLFPVWAHDWGRLLGWLWINQYRLRRANGSSRPQNLYQRFVLPRCMKYIIAALADVPRTLKGDEMIWSVLTIFLGRDWLLRSLMIKAPWWWWLSARRTWDRPQFHIPTFPKSALHFPCLPRLASALHITWCNTFLYWVVAQVIWVWCPWNLRPFCAYGDWGYAAFIGNLTREWSAIRGWLFYGLPLGGVARHLLV